jgi:hypothetical protein
MELFELLSHFVGCWWRSGVDLGKCKFRTEAHSPQTSVATGTASTPNSLHIMTVSVLLIARSFKLYIQEEFCSGIILYIANCVCGVRARSFIVAI